MSDGKYEVDGLPLEDAFNDDGSLDMDKFMAYMEALEEDD